MIQTPSYAETIIKSEAHLWRQTIRKERNNLKTKNIYTLVPRPKDRKIIFGK